MKYEFYCYKCGKKHLIQESPHVISNKEFYCEQCNIKLNRIYSSIPCIIKTNLGDFGKTMNAEGEMQMYEKIHQHGRFDNL